MGDNHGKIRPWGYRDGLALFSLVVMVVVVFWRLALTELIIGRGDVFFYFYPYRDFASAAVRAGQVPLWNPFLFMGVPFLANSQVGFFYPLNLALAWLPVERLVNASIVIHAGLATSGAYLWGRSSLGLSRPGAWLTGLCYGLGGYFVAQVEHLNQVQILAWLPWSLWISDLPSVWGWRVVGLALIVAAQFLAGHIQSVFICLVGLAIYALLPRLWQVVRHGRSWRALIRPFGVLLGAGLSGAALAAIQLWPTFELSQSSVRGGGLPYKEAVSFSLRPDLLGRAMLPGWGASLFPEFVAYVGVVGIGLAIVGTLATWNSFPLQSRAKNARRGVLFLAALGLFMALGGFNPAYFLFVKLVPGFGLFRAPARWLALYAVGAAGLAGIGLDWIVAFSEARSAQRELGPLGRRWWKGLIVAGLALAGLVLLGQLVGSDPDLNEIGGADLDLAPPLDGWSVVGWLAAAFVLGALLFLSHRPYATRSAKILIVLMLAAVTLELLGASLFLPFNRATAPGALTGLRPAVAHLLTQADATAKGPPDRFLSVSDIFFDPGDKAQIENNFESQLSADALYDYLIATKQKEVLIPNLPLYYRLPTMDGYDGGVLPLRRYVALERLYMPAERVAMDGRLREHLETLPDGRWLSLFNVRYVITDKVGDAWFDDVFYDLQLGARLGAGGEATVGHVPVLAATAVGIVYRAEGAPTGTSLAEVDVSFADGQRTTLTLSADETEDADPVARLSWGRADAPTAITVRGTWQTGEVMVRGLSLIDERTGAFHSLVLSDRGRYRRVHSGDVKIYENLDVLPRAFFVSQAVVAADDATALDAMRDPDFDPATTIVLANGNPTLAGHESRVTDHELPTANRASTAIRLYEPEHIVVAVTAPIDGWLLLSDAWYPGWEARVDGEPAPVERANVLFRAVAVPAGEHQVEWVYRPASFRLGAAISLGALSLLLMGLVLSRLFGRFA